MDVCAVDAGQFPGWLTDLGLYVYFVFFSPLSLDLPFPRQKVTRVTMLKRVHRNGSVVDGKMRH